MCREANVLHDRTFVEQMKADILRRAEMSDEDVDEREFAHPDSGTKSKGKGRHLAVAFEDGDDLDLDGAGTVKVLGDGEGSGDDGDGSDADSDEADGGRSGARTPAPQTPETVLELAYIRDPKLFERDAQTRRGAARKELKAQTG